MKLFSVFLLTLTINFLHAQDTTRLSLLFLGDIMQHDSQIAAAYQEEFGVYDYSACFRYIKPTLESADVTIGNLELTLAGPPYKGFPQFSAPDALAHTLKNSGIDVLVTANNHSMDRGRKGVERTLVILDSLKMAHTGTFKDSTEKAARYPLLVEKNGFRFALLNYTYGTNGIPVVKPVIVNAIDTAQIRADIDKAKTWRPDFIVTFFHWGSEYQNQPNAWQKKLTDFCFRLGVKMVIGAHPHVLQPMEWRKETDQVVAYSLGNFVSGQRVRFRDGGAMLRVEVEKVATDSSQLVAIKQVNYELQYVYRDRSKRYYIVPVSGFEHDEKVVKDSTSRAQLKQFATDSRALFSKFNKSVGEYIQSTDSIFYRLSFPQIPSDTLSLLKFYGVEKDSHSGATWVGKFYDLETAQGAADQIKAKLNLSSQLIRFVQARKEEN